MSWDTAVTWIFVAVFLLGLSIHLSREKGSKVSARSISTDSLFLALILLMGFVPQLGYITVAPGLSLTLMHLPVLIGALLYGPKKGLLYGLFFGLTSWLQALSSPAGFNAFFVYPWISVLPRVIFGFLTGLFFQLARGTPKIGRSALYMGVVGFVSTLVHTLLVFGTLLIFSPVEIVAYFQSGDLVAETLSLTFLGVIAVGALLEAALGAALVTPLSKIAFRKHARKGS